MPKRIKDAAMLRLPETLDVIPLCSVPLEEAEEQLLVIEAAPGADQ